MSALIRPFSLYLAIFTFLFSPSILAESDPEKKLEWARQNRTAVELFLQGKHQESLSKMEEVLDYSESSFGKQSIQYAKTLNNLGNLNLQLGKMDVAKEHYQVALEIEKSVLGDDDVMVADSLFNLAMVYATQNEHSKVAELLMRAKTIHLIQPEPDQNSIQRIDQILSKIN